MISAFCIHSCIHDVFIFPLQAKYLAQVIVMGVQVVGRAFARALQQEYAGRTHNVAIKFQFGMLN